METLINLIKSSIKESNASSQKQIKIKSVTEATLFYFITSFQFAFFTNLNALLNSIKTGSITNPPTIP